MKSKILLICFPLLFACNNSENQREDTSTSQETKLETVPAIEEPRPADTYILSLLSLNTQWLRGWDFEPQVWSQENWIQDSVPLTNNWIRIQRDPETSYLENLWILNENSGLWLDLYSHHTSFAPDSNEIRFDANQKIQLFSRDKVEYLDVITFGKSTGIEQGRWLGPSSMILYGFVEDDSNLYHPVLVEIVLDLGYYKLYELDYSVEQNRRMVMSRTLKKELEKGC